MSASARRPRIGFSCDAAMFEQLQAVAERECRSVHRQARHFIKQALEVYDLEARLAAVKRALAEAEAEVEPDAQPIPMKRRAAGRLLVLAGGHPPEQPR